MAELEPKLPLLAFGLPQLVRIQKRLLHFVLSAVMYSLGVQEPEEAIQHNVNAVVQHNVNGGVQRNVGGGVVNDCCPNAVSLLVLPGTMHA